ncbi:F0F1 ATP synthase subunit delta, partial [Flavobacteriaceae bacterium]|nr:F0F1 ATP synthase subunit delta [Flavobacteriaceae bacterium]
MSNSIIVQKYSTAAFNFAKKKDMADDFLSDLKIFSRDISPDFIANSSSPFVSKSSLMDSVNWVLDSMKVSDKIIGFLKILIFNKRLGLIEKICVDFESKLK